MISICSQNDDDQSNAGYGGIVTFEVADNDSNECLIGIGPTTPIPAAVASLVRDSLSANTRRAYASDLARFRSWGGSVPATPDTVAKCLAELSATYAVASLARMLAAISKAHGAVDARDPTKHELVRATMTGIRRSKGSSQRQARPILRDDLFSMLDRLGSRPKDIRDRAMLLLGFATAMRRSELVALDVADIEVGTQGMTVTVRRSKTDQDGKGRQIAVPPGRTRHCPIAAVTEWLAFAGIENGAIFIGVDKHGNVLPNRLSGEAVSHVVRARLAAAGYDPTRFSGHSLRAGFATSAAMAGAPSYKIRETTGHRSEASLTRYIRQVELFNDPAIARLL